MKLVAQMGRKGGFAGSFTDVSGLIVYQTLVFLTNWSLSLKYIYACYIYIYICIDGVWFNNYKDKGNICEDFNPSSPH